MTTETTENGPIWEKKEKRLLTLFAILGLINMLAYIITQSSYVQQNILWVYGFATVIDVLGFFAGLVIWDVNKAQHPGRHLPARVKGFILTTGLWLISIPMVAIAVYNPVISISLLDVLNNLWGVSLVASGMYDTAYVMTILGYWLTKGMEIK